MKLKENWDLSDLYSDIHDPQIAKDIERIKELNLDLESRFKGRLSSLTPEEFLETIKIFEEDLMKSSHLFMFAYLNSCTQTHNQEASAFEQMVTEKLAEYSKPSIFYQLEFNTLSEDKIQTLLSDEKVGKYKIWIERIREAKKYELSEEVEKILSDKNITSGSAWERLYNETSSSLIYKIDNTDYTEDEILCLVTSKDPEVRRKAGEEIERVTTENVPLFTFIYNMIVKDWDIDVKNRGYKSSVAPRNISNNVEDETVAALAKAVRARYADVCHRFFALKANWLGVEKLSYWDRSATLPFDNDNVYPLEDAVDFILEAYKDFSPKLYDLALNFFEKPWVDYYPKKGKQSGAFAYPSTTESHPYLMLNYTNKIRDILVVAHELGHGCHQMLSCQVGSLLDNTPLTLAEVASVFGESLVFEKLLKEAKNDQEKLCLLAAKVEDRIATAFRQIAFHMFEETVHEERKKGELTSAQLGKIWQEVTKECYGEHVIMSEKPDNQWAGISHFFNSPFYVYAYSFTDCCVNSLYGVYKEGSVENFEEKYLELLKYTGVKKYDELLRPFGLDARDPEFWDKGLAIISRDIDELERLTLLKQ